MNLTQNDRLKQVTSDTHLLLELMLDHRLIFAEHLTGEDSNYREEYLGLATPEWDSFCLQRSNYETACASVKSSIGAELQECSLAMTKQSEAAKT